MDQGKRPSSMVRRHGAWCKPTLRIVSYIKEFKHWQFWDDMPQPWPMFNIEVFNSCQMPFYYFIFLLFSFFLFGHFTQMCFAKFPPFTVKASPKIACHKILWLQFASRNIAGLQSWHSSKFFQIPINLAILTLQLWLGTDYNFDFASIAIWERGFSKQNRVKSDRRSRLKLETLNALKRVSMCGLLIENIDWARIFDTWKSNKT